MSNITDVDKRYFEAVLDMRRGYVLDYTDTTFDEFFRKHQINIHGLKYQTYGTSKAKKFRAFWENEGDELVGTVLGEMLDSYEANCAIRGSGLNREALVKCREAADKLSGSDARNKGVDGKDFLDEEFSWPNVNKLPVEPQVAPIIDARLKEVEIALHAKAHLSVIFLCGSVLEGVLYGAAQKEPARFNQSAVKPAKAKYFHEWTLAQFIDVAHDVGILDLDVKKFSHALRDFRNYIHPHQQLAQGFTPDEYTARVCYQVLKAALASVAGDR